MTTLPIPARNLPRLLSKFDALAKRAARLGLPAYADVDFDLHGTVALDGFSFVATLHHEGEGENIVSVLPGEEVEPAWRWANASCDHCGTSRRRSATYLVRGEDGKLRQLGRSCLKDFLPMASRDPERIADWASYVGSFLDSARADRPDEEPTSKAAARNWAMDLDDLLATTSVVMRKYGWVSKGAVAKAAARAEAGEDVFVPVATVSRVLSYLFGSSKYDAEERAEIGPVEEEDWDRARAAIAWAEERFPADDPKLSDYGHNLGVVVRLGYVKWNRMGLAASLLGVYVRDTERAAERERKDAEAAAVSEYVGEIGQRVELPVTVDLVKVIEGYYGTSLLVKMTSRQNVVTTFYSGHEWDPEVGDRLVLRGTVKKLGEFRGVKETTLNRVKVVEYLS